MNNNRMAAPSGQNLLSLIKKMRHIWPLSWQPPRCSWQTLEPCSLGLLLGNQADWMLSNKGHACTTYVHEGYRHRQKHRWKASDKGSLHMMASRFQSVIWVCAWFFLTFSIKQAKVSWGAGEAGWVLYSPPPPHPHTTLLLRKQTTFLYTDWHRWTHIKWV